MINKEWRYLSLGETILAGDQYYQDGRWETVTEGDWFMPGIVENDISNYRREIRTMEMTTVSCEGTEYKVPGKLSQREFYDRMKVGSQAKVGIACVIVSADKKYLFGKRKVTPGKGLWAAAGGHLEYKEKTSDCIRREIAEETGLPLDTLEQYVLNFRTFSEEIEKDCHYITLYYVMYLASTAENTPVKNTEPHKCEGWKWWDAPELMERPKEEFYGAVYNIVVGDNI